MPRRAPSTSQTSRLHPTIGDDAQAVIITGKDDRFDDGNIAYTINTGAMTSTDVGFSGVDPIDVGVTNDDDDTASVTVSSQTGLHTVEPNTTTSFTITLGAVPTSPVTITIASSNPAEGSVVAGPLSITNDSPFTVVVSPVDEFVDDDNQTFTVMLGNVVSADPAFNGLNVPDVTVTNDDNDVAGFNVTGVNSENAFIFLMESGPVNNTAQARINMTSKPLADVVVQPIGQEPAEFDVTAGTSLTFTPVNWQTYQYATLTGKNDGIADTYHVSALMVITTTTDPKYMTANGGAYVNTIDPASVKYTYITSGTYLGNQVKPVDADVICNASPPLPGTWRAAIADPPTRYSCGTAACNWAFTPGKTYVWANFRGLVGVANASGNFLGSGSDFSNGGNYGNGYYWTGLDDNFSTGANCAGWTSTSPSLTGDTGLAGQSSAQSTFSQFAQPCSGSYAIFCIQQ